MYASEISDRDWKFRVAVARQAMDQVKETL